MAPGTAAASTVGTAIDWNNRVGDLLMARAIWSGSISFGLLNVPVRLYSAVARRSIALREIRESDGARIRHRRVAEGTDEEVPYEEIVKAFEITPRQLRAARQGRDGGAGAGEDAARSRSRTSSTSSEIDPIYFDSPYYLGPAAGAEKAYSLLAAGDAGLGQGRRSPASSFATRSTWRRSAPPRAC